MYFFGCSEHPLMSHHKLKKYFYICQNQNINYEIFIPALSLKYTYLINVDTGASWILFEDFMTEKLFWKPIY